MGLDQTPPLAALEDTLSHASATSIHPAQFQLLKRRLYPGYRRYRRNWQALYDFYSGASTRRRSAASVAEVATTDHSICTLSNIAFRVIAVGL